MSVDYKSLKERTLAQMIPELNRLQTEEDWQVHTCITNSNGWVELLLARTKKLTQSEINHAAQSGSWSVPYPSSTTIPTDPDWLKTDNYGIAS